MKKYKYDNSAPYFKAEKQIFKDFETHMKARFGCEDEIITRWINFARDCVGLEKYTDFVPTFRTKAIGNWLKQFYAALSFVQTEGGEELVNRILELSKEHCLYPDEIVSCFQLVFLGEAPEDLMQKSLDGELCIVTEFENKYHVSDILTFDYDKTDAYFQKGASHREIGVGVNIDRPAKKYDMER